MKNDQMAHNPVTRGMCMPIRSSQIFVWVKGVKIKEPTLCKNDLRLLFLRTLVRAFGYCNKYKSRLDITRVHYTQIAWRSRLALNNLPYYRLHIENFLLVALGYHHEHLRTTLNDDHPLSRMLFLEIRIRSLR
ncbi:hypothetical protein GN244_ATG12011 [Phytophthora infestans]|uniref:Uncharacterized protein n=1 Tax=Phytophthora infestans TaxID=4787 RepID=A0A833RZ97_PHYIN|nr:hypothetical protein GN244_ATG12011 [Phytophthora infestans]